ncbi:hypothetical protein D7M15_09160 [Streptomyces sp. Z26]|nr:hypothetical protein D7M15_09160 [Streptomyces sp. Z26]
MAVWVVDVVAGPVAAGVGVTVAAPAPVARVVAVASVAGRSVAPGAPVAVAVRRAARGRGVSSLPGTALRVRVVAARGRAAVRVPG